MSPNLFHVSPDISALRTEFTICVYPCTTQQVMSNACVQELNKALRARPEHVSVATGLSRFLFQYQSTPHSTTYQLLESLFFRKYPTIHPSLIQPSFAPAMQQQHPVKDPSAQQFSRSYLFWCKICDQEANPTGLKAQLLIAVVPYIMLVSWIPLPHACGAPTPSLTSC